MNAVFIDRHDAGKKLARKLLEYADRTKTIVLGLPRGGVPVAYEIANKLHLPLDICLVRKLGTPGNPELAMGAVAESSLKEDDDGQITVLDRQQIQTKGYAGETIQAIAARETAELKWRESRYRHYRPMLTISDRTVIVVDDGIATGMTMQAAIQALKRHHPAKIIVATPVASPQAIAQLTEIADEIVCLTTPRSLKAVGFWYRDFSQTSDREVCDLLSKQDLEKFAEFCRLS